jgi:5-methylcytosine-specific restriction protein A
MPSRNARIPAACAICGRRDCQTHRRRDERPTAWNRGYNAEWRRLRLVILAEQPLCVFCLEKGRVTAAEHVDHIEPIRDRPDLRLVRSNLRALCARCHNRHTAMSRGSP